ncbi:hypothetical protein [Saccharothrix deserti]|uniref:hypothetical protein n=1 Tax=Saccharothrix deserti TaxID=2593674 RepID=UPI00131CA5D1|nr:hypothetical protein [Saccharothrix deserti]
MRKKKQAANVPADPAVQAAHVSRRGAVAVGVIAALATIAAAAITAYSTGRKQGAEASPPSTVTEVRTVTETAGSPATTSGVVPAGSGALRQIKLEVGQAVDLDAADPRPVDATGPDGDLDLHYDRDLLSASQSSLITHSGTQADAEQECPKALDRQNGQRYTPSVGGRFCFRTSTGAVGWASVNSADFEQGPPINYVALNYKLFADR